MSIFISDLLHGSVHHSIIQYHGKFPNSMEHTKFANLGYFQQQFVSRYCAPSHPISGQYLKSLKSSRVILGWTEGQTDGQVAGHIWNDDNTCRQWQPMAKINIIANCSVSQIIHGILSTDQQHTKQHTVTHGNQNSNENTKTWTWKLTQDHHTDG